MLKFSTENFGLLRRSVFRPMCRSWSTPRIQGLQWLHVYEIRRCSNRRASLLQDRYIRPLANCDAKQLLRPYVVLSEGDSNTQHRYERAIVEHPQRLLAFCLIHVAEDQDFLECQELCQQIFRAE